MVSTLYSSKYYVIFIIRPNWFIQDISIRSPQWLLIYLMTNLSTPWTLFKPLLKKWHLCAQVLSRLDFKLKGNPWVFIGLKLQTLEGAFNNYVDQILPNFDPLLAQVDKHGHHTYYLPFFIECPQNHLKKIRGKLSSISQSDGEDVNRK